MADTILAEMIDLVRAAMLRHTARRTRREMARLPSHLIEDVNARGLPPTFPILMFYERKGAQIIHFRSQSCAS